MKKFSTAIIGSLGLLALASGCSMEATEAPVETVGTAEEALVCTQDQGVHAVMATIATAAAKDVRRWLPMRDFEIVNGKLALSQWGRARCPIVGYDYAYNPPKAIKNCKVLNQVLALQDDAAAGMQFGGAALDPPALRSRLVAKYGEQKTCAERPDNGMGDNCPAERHDLVFSYDVPTTGLCGAVGGRDYWYHAFYGDTTTNLSPADAAQLKNQLIFLDGANNPFLAFDSVGGNVKVDPVDGTTGGSGSGSGSCEVANNPVWKSSTSTFVCDATNVEKTVGSCCSCGGINKSWQNKPLMTGWFVCK